MYYLFVEATTVCKWCREPMMQVIEDDLQNVVVRLCPVCDRWPDNFMGSPGPPHVQDPPDPPKKGK